MSDYEELLKNKRREIETIRDENGHLTDGLILYTCIKNRNE